MWLDKYGIPKPVEAAGIFATGIVIGGLTVKAYFNSMLRDKGHTQLIAPTKKHAAAMLEIFEMNGLEPRRRITQGDPEDPTIIQAMMGKTDTVLLTLDDKATESMNEPTCGKTFISKTPLDKATEAAEIYQKHGVDARVDTTTHDETGDPIYHVIAVGSTVALGWRPHGKDMPGPMPPRWQPTDTL